MPISIEERRRRDREKYHARAKDPTYLLKMAERKRAQRAAQPEHCAAVNAAWRERNQHKPAEYMRKSRALDPDGHRFYAKCYRDENKDRINAKRRADRAANPEKYRAYDRRKRAKTASLQKQLIEFIVAELVGL